MKHMKHEDGFSLIELVITITVLAIMTMGVLPLVKVSVKRQKEQQLRETLRAIRMAIDEFHRDTVGMVCTGVALTPQQQAQQQQSSFIDPRSKVVISDCTIFGVDNPDHFPPDLETLVNGVNVLPRGSAGGRGQQGVNATDVGDPQLSTKQKVYMRGLPIDPMTESPIGSCARHTIHLTPDRGAVRMFLTCGPSRETPP